MRPPASNMNDNEFDLIIVGAGAAGIAAAHAARDAGLRAIVLEAKDRAGGRAYTDFESLSRPFDHGCQWLHSAGINPLTKHAERLGFRYRLDPLNFRIHDGAWWLNDRIADEFMQVMGEIYDRIATAGEDGRDVSAESCIDERDPRVARWAPLFRRNFTGYMAGAPRDVSAFDTARYVQTDQNWPVEDGLGALVQRLSQEVERAVEIRLSCPVKSIDWGGDTVMVGTLDGMLFARTVLVTVSTGVLAGERLKFFPLLPDWKREAIAQVPMGFAEKVAFEFAEDPFAGLEPHFALLDWPDAPACAFFTHPFDRPVSIAFLGGTLAASLNREGEAAMVDFAREHLVRVFGAEIARQIVRVKATRWAADPCFGGAYSILKPGGGEARAALARPLDGKLFFAGEATSADAFSTVHGAWQSGLDAMKLIVSGAPAGK
jgi:monoamine oxidase